MRQSKFILAAGLLLLMLITLSGTTPRAQTPAGAKADPNSKTAVSPGANRSANLDAKTITAPGATLSKPDPALQGKVLQNYGKLPLSFEANQGQTDSEVKFLSRGSGYTLFLTGDEAILALKAGVRDQGLGVRVQEAGVRRRATKDKGQRTKDSVVRMKLVGANTRAAVTGDDELPGKSNYFIGNDPKRWRTNVPTYAKVKYENVYPGVDLVYYGNQGQLEYDFVVAPGANPGAIRIALGSGGNRQKAVGSRGNRNSKLEIRNSRFPDSRFPTPDSLRLAANGDLVVNIDGGELRFYKPVVYQAATTSSPDLQTEKLPVEGHYKLTGRNQVAFEVGSYDSTKPLVIDPAINYSTYLGGSSTDEALGVAVDGGGNAYVTGFTYSTDFPVTAGAFQTTCHGCNPSKDSGDAFVTKLNASGSALIYSTYVGGSESDASSGIEIDASGDAYIAGQTNSSDFPVTAGAFQTVCKACGNGKGGNGFVTELNPTGSALTYSTYLGGSGLANGGGGDAVYAITIDSSNDSYLTGFTDSTDFPVTPGAFQTTYSADDSEGFVTELSPSGSALVYSTYLGGTDENFGTAIKVNASGNAYVTGYTNSDNFPTTPGAFQTTDEGNFVTELNAAGSALVYSTYFGPSNYVSGISLDPSGDAYVTGATSDETFPVTPGAFQTTCKGCDTYESAFVSELNPSGSALVYSTFLGGSDGSNAGGITVDSNGDAYVIGSTRSPDFPVTPGAFETTCNACGPDADYGAFLTELNPTGSALVYSTFLGGGSDAGANGITLDASGAAYAVGEAFSGFPVTPFAFQTTCTGGCAKSPDAFVTKFVPGDQVWPLGLSFGNQTVGMTSAPQTTTLTNSGATTLNITSISISANNGTFAQTNTCGSALAAGASCTVTVSWTPSVAGPLMGSINVADNASNSPQTVSLTGTGVLPTATFSTPSLTFPVQVVYTTSSPQTVTLNNTGLGILEITSLVATGNFTETNTCGSTVAPGGSCTITVTFSPQNKGTLTGAVTITDNAPGSPQSVSLSGTGTFVQLTPTSLNFGNQPVRTTSLPRKIVVTNKGFKSMTFTNIGVSGADNKDFTETNNCGTSLASGASCFVTVTFTPHALGARSAAVSILDNGGGSPQSVTVLGNGTP
jgi:hypothetical protein